MDPQFVDAGTEKIGFGPPEFVAEESKPRE
jgi:hypothetical protein